MVPDWPCPQMDIIELKGGTPANFFMLVVVVANEMQVQRALEIFNSDPHVQALLINIFGGIMRCDIIVKGII